MNTIQLQFFRLIIPVVSIIIGIVLEDEFFIAFGIGYVFCWAFSLAHLKIISNNLKRERKNE